MHLVHITLVPLAYLGEEGPRISLDLPPVMVESEMNEVLVCIPLNFPFVELLPCTIRVSN